VANEGSDSLWPFAIRDAGQLGQAEQVLRTGSPVCIAFLP
jgi:6-phosphogluconolactonase (cycloisomerase 2 family)